MKFRFAISLFNCKQSENFISKKGPNPLSATPFWRRIKRLQNKRNKQNIGKLELNGKELVTNEDKAAAFGEKLKDTFSDTHNEKYNNEFKKKVEDFKKVGIDASYTQEEKIVKKFEIKDLEYALKHLNTKTSIDQDGLSNRILKNIGKSRIAMEKILEFFNFCLSNNQLLNYWKWGT